MKNIKRYVHWKVVFTLFFMGLLGAFNPVAAQRPQPLSSLERSLSPNMMMMSNGSRYASYKYFSDWLDSYGDSLNILNPFWLGSILPSQNVNIAAAGNNLTFSQGGIFSFVADTSLAPAYNYQFNINPKISGGQGLFRAQNVSNGYYNGLLFNQLGLTLFADNNLALANQQVQSGALAPGKYEAEFDESGTLNYVKKDTCVNAGDCFSLPNGISQSFSSGGNCPIFGNGRFVILLDNKDSVRIGDGTSFRTVPTSGNLGQWGSAVYAQNLFVAVSYGGSNRVMTSPDGTNWTNRAVPQSNQWRAVTYGNGLFVAVSENGTNRVMTSPDGINWTVRNASENASWWNVTYSDGLFVAVGYSGSNRIMTSPDGINWTSRTAPQLNTWLGITYGNGLFVAVSSDGTDRVMTSPDGINWTSRTVPLEGWRAVTYGNGLFVAVGANGKIMVSEDGVNWIVKSTPGDPFAFLSNVGYGNGLFVATGSSAVLYSGYPLLNSPNSNYIYQGNTNFTGDTIICSNYPNTRNDAGTPSNMLTTDSAGVMQSHPLPEIFAALSAQNTSDQTLTTGVNNAIRFQNVSFTSGSNITITNDTLITINQTGVYELSFDGRFDASASTENTSVQFVATNVADMGANFAFSILTTESVVPMKRIFQVTAVPATIRVIQEATTWASGSVLCAATSSLNIKRLY